MLDTKAKPEVRRTGAALGAEVLGFDLAQATGEDGKWLLQTLAEHGLLVFRNQKLDAARIAALGRTLGEPRPHILLKYRVPDQPEVSMLTNVEADGKVDPFGVTRAAVWHTDMTYRQQLPILAMLHSLEVPSAKGGTMFTDMRAAYDELPEATRERLDKLTALHGDATGPQGYRRGRIGSDPTHEPGNNESRHPAIRVHPISRRRVLFVNPMHTVGFEGVAEDEGVRLIEELAAHSIQDKFIYYHQWRVGDVVMWDETSTMHKNAGDYNPTERRVFMRTIVF
jgi:taurine dioxygenase